jgi:regulator of replication initiation timing
MSADEMMAHRRLGESLERARRAIESLGVRSPNVPAPAIPEGAPTALSLTAPSMTAGYADSSGRRLGTLAAPGTIPANHLLQTDAARISALESEVARLTRELSGLDSDYGALVSEHEATSRELAGYREVVEALNPVQLHNIARVMEKEADREYGKSRENIQELRAVAGQLHGVALALAATPTTEGTKDG